MFVGRDPNLEARWKLFEKSFDISYFKTKSRFYEIVKSPAGVDLAREMLERHIHVAVFTLSGNEIENYLKKKCNLYDEKNMEKKGTLNDEKNTEDKKVSNSTSKVLLGAELAHLLGIKQLIVCVDIENPSNFDLKKFKIIKDKTLQMLGETGWETQSNNKESIFFVPISILTGENIVTPSEKMQWSKKWIGTVSNRIDYKGNSLFEALDTFVQPVRPEYHKPLRFSVKLALRQSAGQVIAGTVVQGCLEKGAKIRFYPSGLTTTAAHLERAHSHNEVSEASKGDHIGILAKSFPPKHCNFPRLQVATPADDDTLGKTMSFVAQVTVFCMHKPLLVDRKIYGQVLTHRFKCKIAKILWKITKRNLKITREARKKGERVSERKFRQENPRLLENGDVACVEVTPFHKISVTTFKECEGLGRIIFFTRLNRTWDPSDFFMVGNIKSVVNELGSKRLKDILLRDTEMIRMLRKDIELAIGPSNRQ